MHCQRNHAKGRPTFESTTVRIDEPKMDHSAHAQRMSLETDLQHAHAVQQSMFPHRFPKVEGFHFAAENRPAGQVGGDFYDLFRLRHGLVGVVMGDVAGKGVAASLYMVLTRTLIRAEAMHSRSPRRVLLRVHKLLMDMSQADIFVTVFYGVLNPETGTLRYVRAGHDRPLLASVDIDACQFLAAKGIVLGSWDQIELDEAELHLAPGDTLVLYSDGITEAASPQGEFFGFGRLCETVHHSLDLSAEELKVHVFEQLAQFQAGASQRDDMTLLIVKASSTEISSGQVPEPREPLS
jgi:sigma-B regulation protein RsbU (phosphoserine phosphatase)